MFIAEALVPMWTEQTGRADGAAGRPDETAQDARPILIVVETLGATLRGQLVDLSECKARVVPNDPFLMCSNVRVTLRFRFNDVVYNLSGLSEGNNSDSSFFVIFDEVTRLKIVAFTWVPTADKPSAEPAVQDGKRSKADQRIVRREPPPGGIERRVHARHVLETAATLIALERGKVFKCLVLEVSMSGCRLFNDNPLQLDEDTLVEVEFTGRGYPFRLAGKVKRKMDEHLVGLEFQAASMRTLGRLQELIGELEVELAMSYKKRADSETQDSA
jgi:hypothetical protein